MGTLLSWARDPSQEAREREDALRKVRLFTEQGVPRKVELEKKEETPDPVGTDRGQEVPLVDNDFVLREGNFREGTDGELTRIGSPRATEGSRRHSLDSIDTDLFEVQATHSTPRRRKVTIQDVGPGSILHHYRIR